MKELSEHLHHRYSNIESFNTAPIKPGIPLSNINKELQ